MFRSLDWKDKRVDINGKNLNNLRFADDVVLIMSLNKLENMLNDLMRKGEEVGLKINLKKTVMIKNDETNKTLRMGNRKIEETEDSIYLGQLISFEQQKQKGN